MLRYTRWLAIGLAMLFAAASSVSAQSIPFSDIMIFGQLTRAGVPMNSKLAVIGVPKGDLQTSPAQRDAIDARLASTLPPDFRYLSRNQLIRVANLIGSGDRVSDDIWANIQSDDPDVVGLVFFDPTSVQGGTAVVTPRIVLRDGQSIIFDPVTVALPETAYEIRLDALLAQFANRLSGIAPASKSLHVSFIQEGLAEPATSFRDCRNVLATRLKKEIATADTARLSSEHRAFVDKAKANLAVTGHLATEGETIFVGLEAPTIGLFEPIQSVKLGSSCILATAKPSCEHGTADDGSCLSKRQVAANELPTDNTIPAWKAYLATCNGCQFEDLASFALQSLERRESEQREVVITAKQAEADRRAWERAKATNTPAAYRAYIRSCNRLCSHRIEAITVISREAEEREQEIEKKKRTDDARWERTKIANTISMYKSYVAYCNDICAHKSEANKARGELEKQAKLAAERDDKLWSKANETRSIDAVSYYLDNCGTICAYGDLAESIKYIITSGSAESKKELRRSTSDKSGQAAHRLCQLFEHGEGVVKNYRWYFAWCNEGARLGNPWSEKYLGLAYTFGLGTQKDPATAAEHLTTAALQDVVWSKHWLGYAYFYGQGVKKNEKLGHFLVKQFVDYVLSTPEEMGNRYALEDIARAYSLGIGVPRSIPKARRYYEMAAKLGSSKAKRELMLLPSR